MSSPITTHVLDTAKGRPAAGVPVTLYRVEGGKREQIGQGQTDGDGRCRTLLGDSYKLAAGSYEIVFEVAGYLGGQGFYRVIAIAFEVETPGQHYHVPLLLSPYGYSTYRGS